MNDGLDHALEAAAASAEDPRGMEEVLVTIVETAKIALPGFGHIGVSTLDDEGNPSTRAATSQLVRDLDNLQWTLWEGPCVDSLLTASVVQAPDIKNDERWPRFVKGAIPLGLRSQLAVHLFLDDEGTVGALNIYSTTSDDVDPRAVDLAVLLASYGSIAVGKANANEEILERLGTRGVISQAVASLMAKYGVGEGRAFDILVRASSHSQRTVLAVASNVVREADE